MQQKPNPKVLAIWRKLKPEQRVRLAALAKTTAGSLRGNIEGRRGISSDLAIRVEKAAVKLGVQGLSRTDLNATCSRCEYARACMRKDLA